VYRFLNRVWRLFVDEQTGETRPFGQTSDGARKALHLAIKETTEGIEQLKFNTPVSRMMEFVNAAGGSVPSKADTLAFVQILSPYAPHLAEELWARMGFGDSLSDSTWPVFDASALVDDTVEIAIQVMGKLRGTISVPADASKDTILEAAKAQENVAKWLADKSIIKEIVVPGRLVNFVIR
jgi:leucyl-tRNA synthetase